MTTTDPHALATLLEEIRKAALLKHSAEEAQAVVDYMAGRSFAEVLICAATARTLLDEHARNQ